jgi:glycosyltransferase involved in cell wall biosynthesis
MTRLSYEKRPELLIRAFARVAGDLPAWDLEIYGDGYLKALMAGLIDRIAPGRIRLHGFTAEPYEILRQADLFVSTSWVEGFGNSIWEALACGVPVVATEAGSAIRSLVRDGVDGVIVGQHSLANALAELMRDDSKRVAMSRRAPEVLDRFSAQASLEKWDELLNHG